MPNKKTATFEELQEQLKTYMKDEDLKMVKKAYQLELSYYGKEKRMTGNDYINHPLSVALILTGIHADRDTICAALIHDIMAKGVTKEELVENFNEVVARLVDGVTKINGINVSVENEYLTTYYKKIIVGMSEDVRVIIIKLADRLHNMRTLYAIPLESQKEKAKETLEILAPIAHRLGMQRIKSELEDLSLRYLKPDVYYDIVERLNNTKLEREMYVNKMMKEVSELLDENGIKHEIKGRAKSIYSIYRKLDKGKTFSNIYDYLAMRVLVDKKEECYLALGLIHSKYKPVSKRFKDYIAMPKTNLYQSLHTTVFGLDGNLFEIQIRTYEMDEISENGIASHWAYKENKNAALEMQNTTEKKLQFYKSIIELNASKMSDEEFLNSVKTEVLNNNVYVYTPKGDVFELMAGATPIDFAYRVHSEIGDKMTGALVNGNIVPLNYELKTGDIVKIITNKASSGPSREWLKIVKTTQAKNKIKSFFLKNSKEDYINSGKDLLEKELRRKKKSITEFMKQENIDALLKEFKVATLEDFYFQLGSNKISVKALFKEDKQEPVKEIKKAKNNLSDQDILVGEFKDIKTHIANCCLALPGDEIVGFITKNKGISIHRKICENISSTEERVIPVFWNKVTKNKYESDLVVYTNSRDNIILDMIETASNLGVSVESFNILNHKEAFIYQLHVLVKDKEHVEKFMKKLESLQKVIKAERVI